MLPLSDEDPLTEDARLLSDLKLQIAADSGPISPHPSMAALTPVQELRREKDLLGVDQVYLINLERRKDRRDKMEFCFDELVRCAWVVVAAAFVVTLAVNVAAATVMAAVHPSAAYFDCIAVATAAVAFVAAVATAAVAFVAAVAAAFAVDLLLLFLPLLLLLALLLLLFLLLLLLLLLLFHCFFLLPFLLLLLSLLHLSL